MSSSMFDLSNKVALVTGASSGLGAHFARVLASAGARVVVGARRTEKLQALIDDINTSGGEAMAVKLDVTQAETIHAALNQVKAQYGLIDILVNSAGVADSKRFVNVDESSFDFVMDTNLKGSWSMAQAVTQQLLSSNRAGSIINIASILGLGVTLGESSYAVSKAAVIQMTKAMALELTTKNIRVNAICPGYFKTEMNADFFDTPAGERFIEQTPAQRLGELHELDGLLLLLSSDASGFMTGTAIPVDGGHLLKAL